MLWIILGIIISYLVGSIPTAYIFGRSLKGIDIRKFGSGNVGATNALRVLGKGPGVTVLLLDIFKGVIPVFFLGNFLSPLSVIPDEALRIALGVSCILGHNWTIFLQFKGGKGIATTLGVLLGLALKITSLQAVLGLTVLTWLVVFLFFRIVSLSSIIAGIALPVYAVCLRQSPILISTSIMLSLLVLLRHKANLARLLQGKEPRISFR